MRRKGSRVWGCSAMNESTGARNWAVRACVMSCRWQRHLRERQCPSGAGRHQAQVLLRSGGRAGREQRCSAQQACRPVSPTCSGCLPLGMAPAAPPHLDVLHQHFARHCALVMASLNLLPITKQQQAGQAVHAVALDAGGICWPSDSCCALDCEPRSAARRAAEGPPARPRVHLTRRGWGLPPP